MFKVKVTAKVKNFSCLFGQYLLNLSSFCDQTYLLWLSPTPTPIPFFFLFIHTFFCFLFLVVFFAWHSGLPWCTTLLSLVTKGWVVHEISSGQSRAHGQTGLLAPPLSVLVYPYPFFSLFFSLFKFVFMTLWPTGMNHHTKFGYERFSSS